jgi:hypothetical protein
MKRNATGRSEWRVRNAIKHVHVSKSSPVDCLDSLFHTREVFYSFFLLFLFSVPFLGGAGLYLGANAVAVLESCSVFENGDHGILAVQVCCCVCVFVCVTICVWVRV